MLIMSRNKHQRLVIGESVVIQVMQVRGDRVWLGISAPADVRIYREEALLSLLARDRIGARPREIQPEIPAEEVSEGQIEERAQ